MGNTMISANAWKLLDSITISNSQTQRLDITNYVNNYSELMFVCQNANDQRHTSPILLPKIMFELMGNGTSYFETGGYFTPSAFSGIRLVVEKSNGTTYKVVTDWCYFEGSLRNSKITVYGR